MNDRRIRAALVVSIGAVLAYLPVDSESRDPGINQPGAAGNRGVGAPGVGVVDPGLNQPGVAGNVGGVARRSVRL
jgi:hypothetical protein